MSSTPLPSDGVPVTAMGFHTTHWTVVLKAARGDETSEAHDALAKLCTAYWYPLYAFIRRRGKGPHDAEDLTQGFLSRLLVKNRLAGVDPGRGKFRSFLLVSLKNFLTNEFERESAQRRGGGRPILSLNRDEAEGRYVLEPADRVTPEDLFERQWAFSVLERALTALRAEWTSEGKGELFDQLEGFLPGGKPGLSRAQLAAHRGVSDSAIDTAVCRMRQRFRAVLRARVAETVATDGEIEDEIRYLIAVISR